MTPPRSALERQAPPLALGDLSTTSLALLLSGTSPVVALLPVGSTEPHGPHLPLATDQLISEGACARAAARLRARGLVALVAPGVPYGVTDFAAGFKGAVSVPAPALSAFLRAVVDALLGQGFAHVCLVNNHLEPAQDAAVRAAIDGLAARASVACPLTRRWGRLLTDEYRSGACHAGQYETSLVQALAPSLVNEPARAALPAVQISLSEGIRRGATGFQQMGMADAYTGSPASASPEEGQRSLAVLCDMIVAEVSEALASPP
jgi:creatinine amidohydrolase